MHFETNGFFQAVIERRIGDAEKELDAVRSAIPGSEAGKGYLKGLEGLLLTAKSNDDKYLYLSKIERTEKSLRALRREFANHTKSNLHTEYDKGYFLALENFVKKLENFDLPKEEKGDAQKQKD